MFTQDNTAPFSASDAAAALADALRLEGLDRDQLDKWHSSPSGKRLEDKAVGATSKATRALLGMMGLSHADLLAKDKDPDVIEAKATAAALIAAELAPPHPPTPKVVTLGEFISEEIPVSRALLGSQENALVLEGGSMMIDGDGGEGKTTLTVDMAFHLASGDDWIFEVPQKVKVLLIENEGPQQPFQSKLERKLLAWDDSEGPDENILIWKAPWGGYSFASEAWRERLAAVIAEQEIDVVIAGPVTALGMEGHGTINETRAFAALVEDVRKKSGRNFGDVLVHHTRKEGGVSGAWEGTGDTLLSLTTPSPGKSLLTVDKARWSSRDHKQSYRLKWAHGESFVREEDTDKTPALENLLAKAKERPERKDQTLTVEQIRQPAEKGGIGCTEKLAKAMADDLVDKGRAVRHEGKDVDRKQAKWCYEAAGCLLV